MLKNILLFSLLLLLFSCSGEKGGEDATNGSEPDPSGTLSVTNPEYIRESGDPVPEDGITYAVANAETKELTIDEFRANINNGDADVVLIDVRTPVEWDNGRIPNSEFMNFYDDDFRSKLAEISRDKKLYFYCASGLRSDKAMEVAKSLGFKYSAHFRGGMNMWSKKDYEIEKD